ncbi:hypothetical protein [Vibrio zhugei]|uniref:hypothetical protein n=1 Tax=Vibrio zhugei TaxID=2479546 RepID=UPI001F543F9E|nr:hypothetical protein [Vibrio zhugei]
MWGLAAKWSINDKIHQALDAQDIRYTHYVSTPTLFNTILWRAVAVTDQGHYEIYASLFDTPADVDIQFYPTDNALLAQLKDSHRVKLLQWFTKGIYGVYQQNNQVILSDLRWDWKGIIRFSFVVAEQHRQHFTLGSYHKISHGFPQENCNGFGHVSPIRVSIYQTQLLLILSHNKYWRIHDANSTEHHSWCDFKCDWLCLFCVNVCLYAVVKRTQWRRNLWMARDIDAAVIDGFYRHEGLLASGR